ncbi:hypothetical protein [Tranquillimonas rosea]|uniref:hypothetical protein n=1 Tax=Tranquillimonas rosea TaxID=641238 RepID=UPI003BAD6D35
MTPKTFSIDLRTNGGARLALSYRGVDRTGIQRLACVLSASDLVRLVLFAETLDLQGILGTPLTAELDLDGLHVETDDAGHGIRLVRRQGYNTQTAHMDLSAFTSEMSGVTEACLSRVAETKHGPVLAEILEESPKPAAIATTLDEDSADHAFHVIREMALMILCEEAETKGSDLARKLRSKTRREDAREDVYAALEVVSSAFLPDAEDTRSDAGLRRQA